MEIGILIPCLAAAVEIGLDIVNHEEGAKLRQLADRIPINCWVAGMRDANG